MKRGQITIFIIVGIVILLVLGLGVAAWKYFSIERPPEDKIIEETNNELEPIRLFVKDCLEAAGKQVFDEIGLHGGYYDPQSYGYTVTPGQPTSGAAFEPFPSQIVPYWQYVSSPNSCFDCRQSTEQPPLEGPAESSIQSQTQEAIEQQLLSCVGNFEQFEQQYIITPKSDPQVTVTFGNNNTIFRLNYIIEVQTQAEAVSTLRDFTATIDLPFRRIYELADEIRFTNELNPFFEGLTIETISLLASEPGEPIPPPFGSTTLTYDPGPFWTLYATQLKVADALENRIGLVQLFGSKDMSYVATSNSTVNALYQNYYFAVEEAQPDISANFLYSSAWNPYVRVYPGGQIIKPDVMSFGLPFLPPMKRKEFDYDVSYPVLVQLQVPVGQESYLFQFPIEVNIRNTMPLTHEPSIIPEESTSYCDPSTWSGATVNITVHDTQNRRIDANLRYDCLSQSCMLDRTVNGKLATQLPVCIGGQIVAEREGFVPSQAAFDSVSGTDEIDITLIRFTTVNITPDVFLLQKEAFYQGTELHSNWFVATNNRFNVAPNQQLIITFTPVNHPSLAQTAIFPGEFQQVKLFPTTYDVSAVLMVNRTTPYVIPEEERCYDTGLFSGDECVTLPAITFGPTTVTDDEGQVHTVDAAAVYIGGLQWDETTKQITLTQDDLDRGAFHVPIIAINLNDLQKIEDLEAFDKVGNLSAELSLS